MSRCRNARVNHLHKAHGVVARHPTKITVPSNLTCHHSGCVAALGFGKDGSNCRINVGKEDGEDEQQNDAPRIVSGSGQDADPAMLLALH